MKKILAIFVLALAVNFAFAQDGAAILKRFVDVTGSEKFKSERAGRSSYLEVAINMGPMTMPLKVTSKYPNFARIEMEIQGNNMTVIRRDTLAWIKAGGKVQKLNNEQLAQMVPMTDIANAVVEDLKDFADLKVEAQQGKGKNLLNVVSFVNSKNKTTGKMFFNAESGLLEKIEQVSEVEGKKMNIKTSFKNYTKFADGSLYLPATIEASTPQGPVTMEIKSFEMDYPTAAWMFAEPK